MKRKRRPQKRKYRPQWEQRLRARARRHAQRGIPGGVLFWVDGVPVMILFGPTPPIICE